MREARAFLHNRFKFLPHLVVMIYMILTTDLRQALKFVDNDAMSALEESHLHLKGCKK